MREIQKRIELTSLIDELDLKVGVEVGVNEGDFSKDLLENSKLDKLYSVDAWCTDQELTRSVFKRWAIRHGEVEKAYETTCEKLAPFGDRSEIIRDISEVAVKQFDDQSIDFIYIDASHRWSGVALDLILWYPKVKWGGIFAGHDYWKCYRCEVMEAVNGFFVEQKQILHLVTDDKDCRGNNNYPPTWWTVKEDRTKRQWLKDVEAARETLLQDKLALAGKQIDVVLPYQYFQ